MERFLLGDLEEFLGGSRRCSLGPSDLVGLVERDGAALHRQAQILGVIQNLPRRHRFSGLADGRAGDPGEFLGVVEFPGQGCDAEVDQAPGFGVGLELGLRIRDGHQLWVEIGVGLLEELYRLGGVGGFHPFILMRGCDTRRPKSAYLGKFPERFLAPGPDWHLEWCQSDAIMASWNSRAMSRLSEPSWR